MYFNITDKTLPRDTFLITVVVFLSAALENAVLHVTYFKELHPTNIHLIAKDETNMTTFEVFMLRSHPRMYQLFGYHPVFALYVFLQHKLLLYSWNFVDIAIAVLGRAIHFRFKYLFEYFNECDPQTPILVDTNCGVKIGPNNGNNANKSFTNMFDRIKACRVKVERDISFSP